MALEASNVSKREAIRVAIRVRPLLPHEAYKDEVIYYPGFEEGPLEVRINLMKEAISQLKVANGQHMVESKYDRVFRQNSYQREVHEFVKGSFSERLNDVL